MTLALIESTGVLAWEDIPDRSIRSSRSIVSYSCPCTAALASPSTPGLNPSVSTEGSVPRYLPCISLAKIFHRTYWSVRRLDSSKTYASYPRSSRLTDKLPDHVRWCVPRSCSPQHPSPREPGKLGMHKCSGSIALDSTSIVDIERGLHFSPCAPRAAHIKFNGPANTRSLASSVLTINPS